MCITLHVLLMPYIQAKSWGLCAFNLPTTINTITHTHILYEYQVRFGRQINLGLSSTYGVDWTFDISCCSRSIHSTKQPLKIKIFLRTQAYYCSRFLFVLQFICFPRFWFVTRVCFLSIGLWLLNTGILLLPFFFFVVVKTLWNIDIIWSYQVNQHFVITERSLKERFIGRCIELNSLPIYYTQLLLHISVLKIYSTGKLLLIFSTILLL